MGVSWLLGSGREGVGNSSGFHDKIRNMSEDKEQTTPQASRPEIRPEADERQLPTYLRPEITRPGVGDTRSYKVGRFTPDPKQPQPKPSESKPEPTKPQSDSSNG